MAETFWVFLGKNESEFQIVVTPEVLYPPVQQTHVALLQSAQ